MIPIASVYTEFGAIEILKSRTAGSLVYRQGGFNQTECDADGVSLATYIHAIYGLLAQARAHDVLMIGCGGGSLGTMLAKAGKRVAIVDINPQSFQIARDYFSLSSEVRCHVADGREFLSGDPHRYDAIVLDAYVGDRIPEHLCAPDFLRLARNRLHESRGCLIVNVHVSHDLDACADRVAADMAEIWPESRLLDRRGTTDRNALVLAGKVGDLQPPRLLIPPSANAPGIARDLEQLAFRPGHPPRRAAVPPR